MDAPGGRRALLLVFVALLAGYLGISRVYLPKRAAVADLEVRLEALRRHNGAVEGIEAAGAVGEAEGELVRLQRALFSVAENLPAEGELSELVEDLTREAQRAGVELSQLHPSGQLLEDGLVVRQFDVVVLGSYAAIAGFMSGLVELPWMVSASLGDLAAESDPSLLEAAIQTGQGTPGSGPRLQARVALEVILAPPDAPRKSAVRVRERPLVASERVTMADPFHSPVQADGWGLRPENLQLMGVIRSGSSDGSIALLARADGARPLRMRAGDSVGGLRVQRIDDDRVLVSFDDLGVTRTITLRLHRSMAEEPA